MFAGILLISRVQNTHSRSLQVEHKTCDTTYDELLSINSDISIHQRHLRFLVTEILKSVSTINPHFLWDYVKMNFFPYI